MILLSGSRMYGVVGDSMVGSRSPSLMLSTGQHISSCEHDALRCCTFGGVEGGQLNSSIPEKGEDVAPFRMIVVGSSSQSIFTLAATGTLLDPVVDTDVNELASVVFSPSS